MAGSTTVTFVLDIPALNAFRSWNGPMGRSFGRLEKETVWRQKQFTHRRTGALQASITSKRSTLGNGNLQFEAGSWSKEYAAVHELGSKPHIIRAKNAPMLVFFWPKVGHVVHFKSVQHPGTRPYHNLTNGLEAAMRMWNRGG